MGIIQRYRNYLPPLSVAPVTLGEGDTPLIPCEGILPAGVALHLKFEGLNPTGSFKDRGMTVAVTEAKARGARLLVTASTGNTAASAAAYGARAGIPVAVLVPDGKVARGKLAQVHVHGGRVVTIQGNFDDALRIVREIAARDAAIALVNSVNPMRLEGQKTGAFEIVDALGDAPTHLALPVGNAGNITAYGMGFRAYKDAGKASALPKLLGFQAEGAAPLVLGHPVARPETVASAIRIGNPASWEKATAEVRIAGGLFLDVPDDEILGAQRLLARKTGIFCEPASATPVAGLLRLAGEGFFAAGDRVVAILTGHGLKDPETPLADLAFDEPVPARTGDVASLLREVSLA